MKKFLIYTDGASRGNPGHASCGFVIQDASGVIWVEEGVYLNQTTNNIAEYSGVKLALERLIKDFSKDLPTEVEIRADSQLMVEQLNGRYKVKNPGIKVLYDQINSLLERVGKVKINHIPREQNFLADRLANQALDKELNLL